MAHGKLLTAREILIAHKMLKYNNISKTATIIICTFFLIVLAVSFYINRRYPLMVISGEASVGTWLSNVLLVMAAVVSLFHALQKQKSKWLIISIFSISLALDERFMFHEYLKELIIFKHQALYNRWHLVCEMPVLVGALIGLIFTVSLWQLLRKKSRILLLLATILGSISVFFDIFNLGAFFEDFAKLLAELLFVCALVQEIEPLNKTDIKT